jgi:hypothetical protein
MDSLGARKEVAEMIELIQQHPNWIFASLISVIAGIAWMETRREWKKIKREEELGEKRVRPIRESQTGLVKKP